MNPLYGHILPIVLGTVSDLEQFVPSESVRLGRWVLIFPGRCP
jgi:hypothetical protein